jgi:hypothetical protein
MDKLIYMNRILIILSALAVQFFLRTDLAAQLTCSNDIFADTTSYTNGEPNDSIFFICSGSMCVLAKLSATIQQDLICWPGGLAIEMHQDRTRQTEYPGLR